MSQVERQELDQFRSFYRRYYDDDIARLAQGYPNERRSLYVDYDDLYRFDVELAERYLSHPEELSEVAEEALRTYDLPADVSLGQAHVRMRNLPATNSIDIRSIRVVDDHIGSLVAVSGIVRKATDVRPKIVEAAFECQRCGTMTYIPQSDSGFQEPHECQGCERQGPFRINHDQSEFVDAQTLRVQESPEGLRGGETPQAIDVYLEDDVCGEVTPGDHVTVNGVLHIEQQTSGNEKSSVFDLYMDGVALDIEDEQFEDMSISDEDVTEILALSDRDDIYERMVGSVAPSIYGYEQEKLAMILQLFGGVTKELPDGTRIRGDMHMLLIGDPGTGKSQLLSYISDIAPRSVYTSGKGSSSAGLTAAAVQDDFGDGQQWTLEAGALVLADQGIAAVDELDKMRCVTGDSLVHLGDGSVRRIGDIARDAAEDGEIETTANGRTIREVDCEVWTMTADGSLVTRPVSAVHEYDAPETLTAVTLESGETLTATDDHPFFVLGERGRETRPAAELEPGAWTYVPRSIPSQAADGGTVTNTTEAAVPDESPSPAMGAILGYLSGDGNVLHDREEGVYALRFTNTEEQLLTDFEAACRREFGADPTRPESERRNGVETVHLHGKRYVEAVVDAGMNLETYDKKAFPTGVTEGSRETKAAFVRALADSEGHVDTATGNVRIASSSRELLRGTKQLLLEFGVSSQIQTERRESGRDVHALAITDAASLESFTHHVGFTLDRKQEAVERVARDVSGDRTILDVVPETGPVLREARESLRLHQSECGLDAGTYCDFETGTANVSIHRARTVLDRFEERRRTAERDLSDLDTPSWAELDRLTDRYHLSQTELAEGTDYSQQRISRGWGTDDDLRETLADRIESVLAAVAATDLGELRDRVRADVKWRRVESVAEVTPEETDDRVPVVEARIADILGCTTDEAVERARELADRSLDADTWEQLRSELTAYDISFQTLADDVGVAGSTVSRWFRGVVETDRFEQVRRVAFDRIEDVQERLSELVAAVDDRRDPSVYDLTVEGTHNFVANGMIVHNSEDRSAMHEALEQQKISISKAGINATLKSRCSLLGAANPKYGRFDQYEPIGEQIDLEPALVSRFDLIFTVTDEPDPDHDAKLADHILTSNYAGELNTQYQQLTNTEISREEIDSAEEDVQPSIEPDLLRKYVAYAKRHCFPRMTDAAQAEIRDFYVDLRAEGADEDAPVPVTARKLEALVRLAEASARIRLSDTVEVEDAERSVEIVRSCLQDIGVDPETGQFDADVVETGQSKTQRDRIKNLKGLIEELAEEYEDEPGAPVEQVIERSDEAGTDPQKAEQEIENLKRKGEVYEPQNGYLRTT
ncbi:MAG: LAGLIDADG family homing endonuclease [Halobaculum sp.]